MISSFATFSKKLNLPFSCFARKQKYQNKNFLALKVRFESIFYVFRDLNWILVKSSEMIIFASLLTTFTVSNNIWGGSFTTPDIGSSLKLIHHNKAKPAIIRTRFTLYRGSYFRVGRFRSQFTLIIRSVAFGQI